MNPATATSGSSIPLDTSASSGADPSQFGEYSGWAQGELAKGFTPAQLQQTLAENNIQLPQQAAQTTAPAAASGKQPSWWQKLLPTAGGVLGGILGTATDVIDGPLGSIGGASGGAALGQMLENKLTGQKVLQGNDLSSAAENGIGEAVGLGAGKVVGALGEGISSAGVLAGAKVADQTAASAATKGALDDATATQLNYGGVSPKLQDMMELGKSQKFASSMGYDATNPYELQKVAQGSGELNNVYDHALQNAAPVKMSDFNTTIFKALKSAGATDNPSASPIGQAIADFNKTAGLDPNAAIPDVMNATDVRKLQQAVGRQIGNQEQIINNAELSGTYNSDAHAQLNSLQDLYGGLGDKIKTPEVNDAIKGLTVTDADKQGLIAQYGDKLGNHLFDTINNAKSADDLLGPMQGFTKMGKASNIAINDIENVTASPRAVARTKFQVNGGVAPSSQTSTTSGLGDTVSAAAAATGHPASAIVSLANKAHKAGLTPAIAKGLGNVLTRTAPLLPPINVAAAGLPAIAAQGQSAIPSSNGTTGASQVNPNMSAAAAPTAANPVNSALETLIQSLQQPGASLTPGYASMVSGVDALAPTVQKNQLAADTVSNLAPTFANAGGAQGTAGGLLSRLTALVPGTAAHTYQAQQQAAATQLAAILGITPAAAATLLPQLMNNQQVGNQQQAGVGSVLNTLTGAGATQ
jgi:hypothetical protein